ncbi:MAG: M48 family metalloprotease, partial [Actinomycetes bacterium]
MNRYINGVKTAFLLTLMAAVIMAIGAWLGGRQGLIIAFGIALAINAYSYWNSGSLAIRAMRAQQVTEAEQPGMHRIVHDLCGDLGQPMPQLYVSPTMAPNAFATGRNPENAKVCCTEGILQLLDERELRGVLAHELSHVANRDILISSIAAAIGMSITFLARFAFFFGGDDEGGGNVFALLLAWILAPIAAMLIQMAVTRSREYQADES